MHGQSVAGSAVHARSCQPIVVKCGGQVNGGPERNRIVLGRRHSDPPIIHHPGAKVFTILV
jgi:hypothetical protein